jgi:hypothetical protein
VGASLLAMAVCQSTSMLDVPASSQASQLPQEICVEQIKITTLVLVYLSIVAFTTHRYWHVMGS